MANPATWTYQNDKFRLVAHILHVDLLNGKFLPRGPTDTTEFSLIAYEGHSPPLPRIKAHPMRMHTSQTAWSQSYASLLNGFLQCARQSVRRPVGRRTDRQRPRPSV